MDITVENFIVKDLVKPKFGHHGYQLLWKFKGAKSAIAEGYYGEYLVKMEKFNGKDMWIGYFIPKGGLKENLCGFNVLPNILNWLQEWEDNMCTFTLEKYAI